MIRFENAADFVEIGLSEEAGSDISAGEDVYLTIVVSSEGFCGHNDLWILGSEMETFCRRLVALERNRQGETTINSISPGELRLTVRSVDSRGHMLVEGATGYHVQRENGRVWHSVNFGFEFDPSQLVRAVNVGWVRRHREG